MKICVNCSNHIHGCIADPPSRCAANEVVDIVSGDSYLMTCRAARQNDMWCGESALKFESPKLDPNWRWWKFWA